MGLIDFKLPAMGESVMEATVTAWKKNVGDTIENGDIIVEVATDKVDNEIPVEVSGRIASIYADINQVVKVGDVIAKIETDADTEIITKHLKTNAEIIEKELETSSSTSTDKEEIINLPAVANLQSPLNLESTTHRKESNRYYSPLIKKMAIEEGISLSELDNLKGTGEKGRFTKVDFLKYLKTNNNKNKEKTTATTPPKQTPASDNTEEQLIVMDRVRKMIGERMSHSLQVSPHVQTFIDVDVTNLVKWRAKIKDKFLEAEGEKLTFTPLFVEVIAKALRHFPILNSSIEGDDIHIKKHINLGMATAMENGNLIVPVIKKADMLNLVGLAKTVNDLATRARIGNLKPDETQGGTYTFTNIGSFGSLMGTPIINQPQVGILALGAIQKVPAVLQSENGNDSIGICHKMYLSHSYDHRIIDGAIGGLFVKKIKEYLENWNVKREIG